MKLTHLFFKNAFIISAFLFFLYPFFISARDIDLDSIYIKTNSRWYKQLIQLKLQSYDAIQAAYISNDVIFAGWLTGNELLYIKEIANNNYFYIYNRIRKTRKRLFSIRGVITTAFVSQQAQSVICKNMRIIGEVTKNYTIVYSKRFGLKKYYSSSPFLDFSISPDSKSIIKENSDGIYEIKIESNDSQRLFQKSQYYGVIKRNNPTVCFISPNRKNALFLNGSGGNYKSLIFFNGKKWFDSGINAIAETFWLDNRYYIYRSGYTGNHSLILYDALKRKKRYLCINSLNINATYSPFAKTVSFLKNQLIQFYFVRSNRILKTGLEGEDVYFTPDGSRFSSIFSKKLFITSYALLKVNSYKLRVIHKKILHIYKRILKNKSMWKSAYTRNFLIKKIKVYSRLY